MSLQTEEEADEKMMSTYLLMVVDRVVYFRVRFTAAGVCLSVNRAK